MIKVENLSHSFPNKDLYHKISFTLEENQHCAFIGTSGSGKSTLVEIIMDPEKYMYDGLLERDPNLRIGYVSQFFQPQAGEDVTVFNYIAAPFLKLQNEIHVICDEMAHTTDLEALLEVYQLKLDAYDAIGGDDYESLISKKLNLAELMPIRDLKVSDISGGEFKLVQVIKEMLLSPNLLIMDEPDVFLDFENLNALRNLINAHKGILLVITHSRYLLNHCFNKIIHLENKELQEFDGTYIEYNFSLLQKKVEQLELSIADDEKIMKNELLIGNLRTIATHNTDASRGRALKARVRFQERLLANRIKTPFVEIKQPEINLTAQDLSEIETVLEVHNYQVAYDELLLDHVSFTIGSKDKVAIIGANGTGKTTLLRDIYRQKDEHIKLSEGVHMAYLTQNQGEGLDESQTLINAFFEADFNTGTEIKQLLSQYGFDESRVNQKLSSFSGGEKNLIQLAKMTKCPVGLLLLDEPTSHLDTYSQLALEKAIQAFQGAVLMVSHDYYTIINAMDYVLIVEDKTIRKMSIRKFRKMIYESHFDKAYLERELKRKELETKVERALSEHDFETAKVFCEALEDIILEF